MEMVAPTRVGMSLDDFIEEFERQPFELFNGERVVKMPNVWGPSKRIHVLFVAFYLFVTQRKLGQVLQETTFIVPGNYGSKWVTDSRVPDIMFFSGIRLEDYEVANPDADSRPLELVPDFAVEIVSPTDKYTDITRKVDLYLEDGVRLIWLIDPQRRKAVIYAPGQPPLLLNEADILHGGDIIPGFAIQLAELFK